MARDLEIEVDTRAAQKVLGKKIVPVLKPALKRGAERLIGDFKKYPIRPKGHWAANTTPAQKRAFFAQLKNGGWKSRTMVLAKKWTWRFVESPGRIAAEIGNNAKYAQYVQSGEMQAAMHRGIWQNTDEAVVQANRRKIIDDIESTLRRAMNPAT